MALLEVQDLVVGIKTPDGMAPIVRGVDLKLEAGGTLGLVGESGCGKSITALALMGLLPRQARAAGAIRFEGADLLTLDEDALCRVRGNRIGMIFQEPMTSLNPAHRVGRQISEGLRLHRGMDDTAARAEALRLLERVRLPQPARRLDQYPHELSGGQRQRVMIAMALSCSPALLIADEPTTALDVTVQARILDLLRGLVAEMGMALILISHDLGVVAETCETVCVMYAGKVVETGPTARLFERRAHPYTRGLFAALPRGAARRGPDGRRPRLYAIPGVVPDPMSLPPGCSFADRCPRVVAACRVDDPPPLPVGSDHWARCPRIDVPDDAA
jgi:peptide/nickel transport system ATP-binding protein